ncbi:MAG: DUF1028 domain-containing protein [Thermomicrobiales bacterium]|nr:DUF1028 domain-containing protein [Thermomicrobiales bacterium]
MTFSITARCPETGQLGVAVSTALLCVGALVPFIRSGVGAVATQSFVNPYIGIDGLDELAGGANAEEAVARLAERDEGRSIRQFAVVDRNSNAAAYSGADCVNWFGHRVGEGFAVAGNMLVGEPTILEMARAYEASAGESLAERLVRALEAGQAAGGDKRGRQSAALKVFGVEEYPIVDLRVDDHPDPVVELRRLWGLYNQGFGDVMGMLPTKAHPAGLFDMDQIRQFLPK